MGLHFYDSSTYSFEDQKTRLQPAYTLSQAGIPCVVGAEDALAFVHFVPTCLFTLQLIIPDESLEAAAQAITTSLPYERSLTPLPHYCEYKFINPTMPNCFPNSIVLKRVEPMSEDDLLKRDDPMAEVDPDSVLLHPQSYFPYGISKDDSSVSLEGFPPNIRFPTRPAFFDLLAGTALDPSIGFRHQRLHLQLMTYIAYLITYTLRKEPRVQPNGEFEAEHASMLASMREENRPFIANYIRNVRTEWLDEVRTRREILVKLGREVDGRPLPRDFTSRRSQGNHITSAGGHRSCQYSTMSYTGNIALSGISRFRFLFRRVLTT